METINSKKYKDLRPITPHALIASKLKALHKSLKGSSHLGEAETLLLEDLMELTQPLYEYLEQSTTTPSLELQALEKATNEINWDDAFAKAETEIPLEREMLTGSVQGQFLKMLISMSNAKSILEIGSFTGYGSLSMAEALPEDGKLYACEYDSFTADFAEAHIKKSKHSHKITFLKGDAKQSLQKLANEGKTFDFVFIDADKQGYLSYYKQLLDLGLLNKQGTVCVDNTLFMGQSYGAGDVTENGKAIAAFNKFIAEDDRINQVLVPIRDGITLIRLAQ